MTPPRCNHPCAPRSTSSVYRLPTPFFEAPCTVNRFNRHCTSTTRYTALCSPASAENSATSLHTLLALSSCSVPWRCRPQAPHRAANMPGKDPNRDEKWVDRAPSAEGILQKDGKRHVRRWRQDREKPFDCDKNMLETENGADSRPNHGRVITLPSKSSFFADIILKKQKSLI